VGDEIKQPWYKSIPGILTAATGLIAALSGLVAGLNQLGAFRREPPAATVGMTPAPADNTAQDSAHSAAAMAHDSAALAPAASPRVSAPSPAAPPAGGAKPSPAPSTTRPAPDIPGAASIVLPKGTAISLAVPSRTCAPAEGARRFTARLDAPVQVRGATVLPAGATAVLRLRRATEGPVPRARLDSLIRSDLALPISSAQVRVPRASAAGACLRAGARLTAVLGEPVTVPRS
jgi:hypothetical protein